MFIRPAAERGRANLGWLDSRHTFSFGEYYDPNHMGFGVLRVINDDRVQGGGGFPRHPHRDMEIVSYVVEGALSHQDTLGNGSVIRPGEVQRMSAGTGIAHSEMNQSRDESVRFLQIWIFPDRQARAPGYEQKAFPVDPNNPLTLVVTQNGENGTVSIGQDVRIYRALFSEPGRLEHALPEGRSSWVQVVRGTLELNGQEFSEGDGVALPEGGLLELGGESGTEALLFDLPEVTHAQ